MVVPCHTATPGFLRVAWGRACHEPCGHTASQRASSVPPLTWSPSTPSPLRSAPVNIYCCAASCAAFPIFPPLSVCPGQQRRFLSRLQVGAPPSEGISVPADALQNATGVPARIREATVRSACGSGHRKLTSVGKCGTHSWGIITVASRINPRLEYFYIFWTDSAADPRQGSKKAPERHTQTLQGPASASEHEKTVKSRRAGPCRNQPHGRG